MERLPHPNYARRTAAATFGLIAAGLVCLVLGVLLRSTRFRALETVLNLGVAGCALAFVLRWFTLGDSTACPRCGLTLSGDRAASREDEPAPIADPPGPLTFTCENCRVIWVAQTNADI